MISDLNGSLGLRSLIILPGNSKFKRKSADMFDRDLMIADTASRFHKNRL